LEVLRLGRSRRNNLAPINRIPPEVLALVPNFLNKDARDRATVALTHVCQVWREIFTSSSTLWTDFDCEDIDKTLVYLNRSGSSPISVQLERNEGLSPYDPFLQVIPHIITRLTSVAIHGTPENLQDITTRLSRPAPLLKSLTIEAKCECSPQGGSVITTTLFDGDLSLLRELHLRCIRTELPWRNMANLTSFTLGYTSTGDSSVGPLLDFFESAPRLREIRLHFATPTFGAQTGRLVSLSRLKWMDVLGGGYPSLLLEHLLVPAGAKVTGRVDPRWPPELPNPPEFIEELSGFGIHLSIRGFYPRIRFIMPDWEINIVPATPWPTTTYCVPESFARIDLSNIEWLRLAGSDLIFLEGCDFDRELTELTGLRSVTISRCKNLSAFIPFLGSMACPNLEEFVLDPNVDGEKFDIQSVIGQAARRASRGARLKSVRIVSWDTSVQTSALKLEEYVSHVECSPRVAFASGDVGISDEED